MFKVWFVTSVGWILYTAAIIGYMIAVFTYDTVSTSAVIGILKIVTCLLIAFAFCWMFHLNLVMKKAYDGHDEIRKSDVQIKTSNIEMGN